jgi:four helix bundle protein
MRLLSHMNVIIRDMADPESNSPPGRARAKDSRDPLGRMRVYQLARALIQDAWNDAEIIRHNPITVEVAGQLYSAVTSIEANISEGYSRSSGRDRARIFEYALGSTRESMTWYNASQKVLDGDVVTDRLDRLEEIRRLLLAIVPRERDRLIRPVRIPPIQSENEGVCEVQSANRSRPELRT